MMWAEETPSSTASLQLAVLYKSEVLLFFFVFCVMYAFSCTDLVKNV